MPDTIVMGTTDETICEDALNLTLHVVSDISDNISIVTIDNGAKYLCESLMDSDSSIYMKVSPIC